jgi:hypothetical protein
MLGVCETASVAGKNDFSASFQCGQALPGQRLDLSQ